VPVLTHCGGTGLNSVVGESGQSTAERAGLIHQFIGGVGFRFRLRDMLHYWREGTGSVVDRHMLQHVRCRLKGRLANLVHADRVPAVTAYHESAACNLSGRCVHALSLRSGGGQSRTH